MRATELSESSSQASPNLHSNLANHDPRNVFVVYGRDSEATSALWTFLEALGLHPLSWDELVASTGTATPYTGEVVAKALDQVQAVVVFFTPDDEARLHESLRKLDDPIHESSFTGQPRPNVFFEAGMAFARHPDRTIIVEVGNLRPASDLLGRNVVKLGSTAGPLRALASRLRAAGCPVDLSHPSWSKPERFGELAAQSRVPVVEVDSNGLLPLGTRRSKDWTQATTKLKTRLIQNSENQYLLEVANKGTTDVAGLSWSIPADATNWTIMVDVLPQYPISELRSGDYVRVPVMVLMGGPVITTISLRAVDSEGVPYSSTGTLSIYG